MSPQEFLPCRRLAWRAVLSMAAPIVAVTWLLPCLALADSNSESGAAIYERLCAECHGADGQGTTGGYEHPLYGELSVEALARRIEKTMPEGNAEACVGEDAKRVAQYIFDEFYSSAARQRKGLAPVPRVELARLTVDQYRNSIADLVGRFTPEPGAERRERRGRGGRGGRRQSEPETPPVVQPGLRAEYFESKGMNKADSLKSERVDHRIDFNFGEKGPADDIAADQFCIVWQGSLWAPTTGHYEFKVTTENGARLYLNCDPPEGRRKLRDDSDVAGQSALIDAWVSSGKLREESARVYLLGGRNYPFRLEFFKYMDKTASIRLEWKTPHGPWQVLDQRYLSTADSSRVFVVEAPLPPDDRSAGYERGSSISSEWLSGVTQGAIDTAQEVVNRLPLLSGVDERSENREERLKEFVMQFAEAAFRRPLTDEEQQYILEVAFNDEPSLETAVRKGIILVLTSPHFLYADLQQPLGQEPSPHAVAARLALTLWDSIPDAELVAAAQAGQLQTEDEIREQARRMLNDPRARAKIRRFFQHWLEIEERDLGKDREKFPAFDDLVVADLRYSLELFLDELFWSDTSDYRELLTANYLYLNDRLSALYAPDGSTQPAGHKEETEEVSSDEDVQASEKVAQASEEDAGASEDVAQVAEEDAQEVQQPDGDSVFQRVEFPPERRVGVLTHPYLLSAFSYHNNTSPIHRGVFLTRNIIGRPLKPPPVAVAFKEDEFPPDLTMREKITQLTRDAACMSCHSVINPLGFALENYDAVGRWRTEDNNKPIDSSGHYTTPEGETHPIHSARDVAEFASGSDMAHSAFVTQLFRHLAKQNPAAYGPATVDRLCREFAADEYNMQNLMVRIAVTVASYGR